MGHFGDSADLGWLYESAVSRIGDALSLKDKLTFTQLWANGLYEPLATVFVARSGGV
jgi:hypothetical protein